MTSWILILTLVAPASSGGSSMASVPGFASLEECAAAGNGWLQKLPGTWSKASAVCAQQTAR